MAYVLRAAAVMTLIVHLSLFLAGCSGDSRPPGRGGGAPPAENHTPQVSTTAAPREVAEAAKPANPQEVVIDNFRFSPRELTVAASTKVTWVNRDDVPHTATSTARPKLFDSRTLDTDGKFAHVFTTPGTYEYFCAVHPHMTGKIIVK
jgi:plastocyanin